MIQHSIDSPQNSWRFFQLSESFNSFPIPTFPQQISSTLPHHGSCNRKRTSDGNIIWKFYCLNFCCSVEKGSKCKSYCYHPPPLKLSRHGKNITESWMWFAVFLCLNWKQIRAEISRCRRFELNIHEVKYHRGIATLSSFLPVELFLENSDLNEGLWLEHLGNLK
jgi:hypothetical protein